MNPMNGLSSLAARRSRLSLAPGRAVPYAALAILLGLAGWLIAGVPDTALVPVTALLALAGAIALGIVGLRTHSLSSPLVLLGVPLLLSLAAAMQPITRIFGEWSPSRLADAVLIVLAPLAGAVAATLLMPGRTPLVERGSEARPRAQLLVLACLAMTAIGAGVYFKEWASIGGPPLLSSNIDEARFSLDVGVLHVLTEGLSLALLIATWARAGRARCFSALQKRALEGVMAFGIIVLALGGGRSFVIVPVITAFVVASRYVSPRATRRMMILIPLGIVLFSSAIFLARIGQHQPSGAVGSVLYNETGSKTNPLQSVYRSLSINLGEQLRVVAELRDADIRTPPFSSSIWFAHNLFPSRAVDPQVIAGPNAGGWLTSTWAGGLLLDFGLVGALLFGVAFGAAAQVLYRRFARGRTITITWIYAYLAPSIVLAFYINMFLYFIFPILDVIALLILSRLLIERQAPAAAG